MAMHPKIIELTEQLFPVIGSFLKVNADRASMKEIADFLKDKRIEGLTFRRTYPYSYQLDYIITNLIRKGLLDEHGNGDVSLTLYGKKKIGLNEK